MVLVIEVLLFLCILMLNVLKVMLVEKRKEFDEVFLFNME